MSDNLFELVSCCTPKCSYKGQQSQLGVGENWQVKWSI